jgi:hypothetical protein
MLTTHPLLVPRLRKSRSYTSSHPNAPLWSVTGPFYLYALGYLMKKDEIDKERVEYVRYVRKIPIGGTEGKIAHGR